MMSKKVLIKNGQFKGIEGTIVGDCKLTNEWLIQIDRFSIVKVNKNDIEQSNLKEVHLIHNNKVSFETYGNKILITVNIMPYYNEETVAPMFDENDKAKSLSIAINEYKIKALKIELNKLRRENAELQGLLIK